MAKSRKDVDRGVRKHAWSLLNFFSIQQHVIIATNQVEEARDRLALQGYERREVQEDLRTTFEENLVRIPIVLVLVPSSQKGNALHVECCLIVHHIM